MEDKNSALIPYVMQVLCTKPQLCENLDNLYNQVEQLLIKDGIRAKYNNLQKAMKKGLLIAQNLGIVFLTKEIVRMPMKGANIPGHHTFDVSSTGSYSSFESCNSGNNASSDSEYGQKHRRSHKKGNTNQRRSRSSLSRSSRRSSGCR